MILCVLFLITSCAPKLTNIPPPVEEPQAFSYTGTEVIPEKWWTTFKDTALNTLIDSALSKNMELAATWQQVLAARAIKKRQASTLWPQVEANARTSLNRPQANFTGGEDIQLGFSASYEFDLWGRLRSAKQAEAFRAQASYYDYQTTALVLSTQIATIWYQLVTAQRQLTLVNQQIETNNDIVELIQTRFSSGQTRAVDILRQRQLLESTRNIKIGYETDVALLQNQLAVLVGEAPQNNPIPAVKDSLPSLPPLPETGLPLELIRKRPDVQQAQHLLLAADRDMAEAVRSQYPRLSVSATGQFRSNAYNDLFKEWAYSLAANLVAPLFYGGQIRAEIDHTEALKNQQLYNYGQTVLTSFREVEDALLQEQKQNEQLESLRRQLELTEKANRQLKIEFLYGAREYLDVLLSLNQEQQLRRDVLTAEQTQLEIRIDLYRALAGGFEIENPATP
ncbi:TolC family protein [uncultured Marixanthomonas sp.]|uniref:TolC family protein n=1 Tax=uncultured Marixanthomonas sp. TaxID=757245 RepID=UPI0030D81073